VPSEAHAVTIKIKVVEDMFARPWQAQVPQVVIFDFLSSNQRIMNRMISADLWVGH
jgi:hypothetical protein